MSASIHFRCTAPEHQRPVADPRAPSSPVTYHDGHWAYCPLGFHDGHVWLAIAPSSLDEVKHALRSEVPVAQTPS